MYRMNLADLKRQNKYLADQNHSLWETFWRLEQAINSLKHEKVHLEQRIAQLEYENRRRDGVA